MNNRIPRSFNEIIGKMLINTSMDNVNDIIHIRKDDYNRLLAFNTRTQQYAQCFISMLRNAEVFQLIEVKLESK